MFPSHPKCSPGMPAVPALFSCLTRTIPPGAKEASGIQAPIVGIPILSLWRIQHTLIGVVSHLQIYSGVSWYSGYSEYILGILGILGFLGILGILGIMGILGILGILGIF